MSHSHHSDSSRSLWSRDGDDLGLTVYGSPAPRSSNRAPRAARRRPSQPPNSPARPLTLPIDRLMQLRVDLNARLEKGCGLDSGRAASVASSHPDLALDLSSITTDSCAETERSSTASSYDESEWTDTWIPVRSLPNSLNPSPISRGKVHSLYAPLSRRTNETSNPPRRQLDYIKRHNGEQNYSPCSFSKSFRAEDVTHSGKDRSSIRSRESDLIEVYVETVNNAQLSKFFRQCSTCGQASCRCPPSPLDRACLACGQELCKCLPSPLRIDQPCAMCGNPICECPSCIQCCRGECSATERLGDHSTAQSSSIFSQFMLERRFGPTALPHRTVRDHAADSGNSTLQLNDSSREVQPECSAGSSGTGGILSRKHVSLSVMQLATAAQCARILADSLESVLQLARDELKTEGSGGDDDSAQVSESTLHHDSLVSAMSAFSALHIPSPSTHMKPPENTTGPLRTDQQQRNIF